MTWLRSHRRRLAIFSVLVLALQALAVSAGSHANAAASTDGFNLVPICTSNGVRVVDMSVADEQQQQDPSGPKHQCPLCTLGCAAFASPALPYLYATVVLLFEPQTAQPPKVAVVAAVPSTPQSLRPAAPRGPPALA